MMRLKLAICVLCLFSLALGAQAYRLQYKDTVGATRSYLASFVTNGTSTANGHEVPINMTMTMCMTEKVVAKNADQTSSIVSELKDGKEQLQMPDPSGNGQTITREIPVPAITMSYDRSPLGAMTNLKMNGGTAAMLATMHSLSNPTSTLPSCSFPDHDVQIGDTWTQKVSYEMSGACMQGENTYTLVGTKDIAGKTYLVLQVATTVDVPSTDMSIPAPNNTPAMKMTIAVKATGKTEALFDEQAGEVGDSKVDMQMDMQMNMPMPNGSGNMQMTMAMTMQGTLTRQ
jgi:hypothetical protein